MAPMSRDQPLSGAFEDMSGRGHLHEKPVPGDNIVVISQVGRVMDIIGYPTMACTSARSAELRPGHINCTQIQAVSLWRPFARY